MRRFDTKIDFFRVYRKICYFVFIKLQSLFLFLVGIHLLCVVVYNFSWTIEATPRQLNQYEVASRKSWWSLCAGVLFLLSFTSSIYHLLFMSLLRLFAVTCALKYAVLKGKDTMKCLVVIWLAAATAATVPG